MRFRKVPMLILSLAIISLGMLAVLADTDRDGKAPSISSTVVNNVHGNPPGLQITAKDNVMLGKIVILDEGKPVLTKNIAGKAAQKYTIVYPFLKPGSYNAVAYDAAGNRSLETKAVTVADQDSDGLSDDWEIWLGTDPGKKDSDGDGIDDQIAYLLGMAAGGRLPAAAALLINASLQETAEAQIPQSFWENSLVSGAESVPEESADNAPKLNGSAVIVTFSPVTGDGWAFSGSRLMHFAPSGDAFACDAVFALQGAYGALRLVSLSSADGGVMLLAHWNETTGRAEGPLKILDTRTKKTAVMKGSENAAAFDISPDGARAAFSAGGRVHVIDLIKGADVAVEHDASALTFTPDGRLALYTDGGNVLFADDRGKAVSEAYEGMVDAAQRTNTTRKVIAFTASGVAQAEAGGILTFPEDGKKIVYKSETGPLDIAWAEDFEEKPEP
jgi:hypothetical protein